MPKTATRKKTETLKTETFERRLTIQQRQIDEDNRTVEVAFSSEEPVERWFGTEILDHAPESVRLDRLQNGGAVLVDHDPRDHIGTVEEVSIDADRRGRAVVRLGNSARANEIFRDVVDGIRKHISVAYLIHEMKLEESGDDGDIYRMTDWEPLEISFVSIPADASVGVGRSMGERSHETTVIKRDETMSDDKDTTANNGQDNTASDGHRAGGNQGGNNGGQHQQQQATAEQIRAAEKEAREKELERVRNINAVVKEFPQLRDTADQFIYDGKSADEFRQEALKQLKNAKPLEAGREPGRIGMDANDMRRYSLLRALRAAVTGDWKNAEFERECSDEAAKLMTRSPEGIVIPYDVLAAPQRQLQGQRDQTVGTTTAGGYLVGTDHLAGSFIELLRNRSVTGMLGATVLDGLIGNVDIPRQAGGATFYWIDNESGDTTESNLTFGQLALSPKTVSGRVDITRRLLQQSSPAVDMLVRNDFARGIGLAIDLAAINGSGSSNQPRGIKNTSGIGSSSFNAADPTWGEIVELESEVAADNADMGALAYAMDAAMRGALKTTEKATNTGKFIWNEEAGDTPVNGYPVGVSNQVTDGDVFFGNWNDLIIAMWGGLDVKADDVTLGERGGLVLRVFQDIDIGVRHAESFALGNDG